LKHKEHLKYKFILVKNIGHPPFFNLLYYYYLLLLYVSSYKELAIKTAKGVNRDAVGMYPVNRRVGRKVTKPLSREASSEEMDDYKPQSILKSSLTRGSLGGNQSGRRDSGGQSEQLKSIIGISYKLLMPHISESFTYLHYSLVQPRVKA